MAYFLLNLRMQFDKNLIKNEKKLKLKGLWFFGLSGSGKSYASNYINKYIAKSFIIDGDEIRSNISFDLGYCLDDRKKQVKRIFGLATICINQGFFPLISTVYFDKKLTNNLKSIGINLIEIKRNSKIVNFKNINKENVVGKDITQEKITCDKIVNDIDFKKKLRGLL